MEEYTDEEEEEGIEQKRRQEGGENNNVVVMGKTTSVCKSGIERKKAPHPRPFPPSIPVFTTSGPKLHYFTLIGIKKKNTGHLSNHLLVPIFLYFFMSAVLCVKCLSFHLRVANVTLT